MNNFSIRLKDLRRSAKVRQTDIAELLSVTARHYQQIEYGKVDLPTSKLIALADYFNVSLDYLVGRSDDPTRH